MRTRRMARIAKKVAIQKEAHAMDDVDVAKILMHRFEKPCSPITCRCPKPFPPAKSTIPDQEFYALKSDQSSEASSLANAATPAAAVCVTPDTNKTKKRRKHETMMQESNYCILPPSEADCFAGTGVAKVPTIVTASKADDDSLHVLSSALLTSQNLLKDQIKYLPDSTFSPADYSYDEKDENKLDEQVDILRKEFDYLLWGVEGMQRADFLVVPRNVLELLRNVWNLDEDPAKVDRVGKRLVPVQSFFPNLLNILLQTPGFPTVSDVFDSSLFRSFGRANVKGIENSLKALIRETLERMGYPCDGQDISFYLSFMQTRLRTIVQDPHIDFKWDSVDPWFVDDSPMLRRNSKRGRKLDYKERVPFIAFFPLTPDGMAVEVWQAREEHSNGRDGVLVHIPFGCMMIARGDVVHAGGFSNSSNGNPRSHLYIYRSGGEVHDINTSNTYTKEIDGKIVRMSQIYKHGPGI